MRNLFMAALAAFPPRCKNIMVHVAAFILIFLTCAYLYSEIDSSRVKNDGLNNYYMAYNLAERGAFSETRTGTTPSMSREPVPVFVLAAWLKLHFTPISEANPVMVNGNTALITVKSINIGWAALVLAMAYGIGVTLTGSNVFGLLSLTAVASSFLYAPWQTNILNTDLAASGLLLLSVFFALKLLRSQKIALAVFLGCSLGLLALTKAVTLYASVVFVVCLIGLLSRGIGFMRSAALGLTALVALGATSAPWIARNYFLFEKPAIALRGGRVLNYRALLDLMPLDTYKASFWYWSDKNARPALGRLLGYTAEDADRNGTGPAAPLNRGASSFRLADKAAEQAGRPQDAIALLSKMRARHDALARKFKARGAISPTADAQAVLQREAVEIIVANPVRHVALSVPVFWSMMWLRTVPLWIGPLVCASMFIALILAVLLRNRFIATLTLLPVGIMTLYVLTSHGLARYSEPMVPLMIIAAVTCIAALHPRLRREWL